MQNRPIAEVIHHRNPVTVPAGATVREACTRMRDHGVGAVLVTDEAGRLLGIFTGRDAVCRMLAQAKDATRVRLAEVMTKDPASLPPGASAMDAVRLMRDGGFRHVPVVQDDGRLVGVVSRGDFRAMEHARLDEETGFFEVLR